MTKICPISHQCFRHPVVCTDKYGNVITLELREFYRHVQTNRWLVNSPGTFQPITTAVYNQNLKVEIDAEESNSKLERERYSDYNRDAFNRFLQVINSSRPVGKPLIPAAGIAGYPNRGMPSLRIPTLLGLIGGCVGYAQNELKRNKMVDNYFYQVGCRDGQLPSAKKWDRSTSDISLPIYEATMSAFTAFLFLSAVFELGERSSKSAGNKMGLIAIIFVIGCISSIAESRNGALRSIYGAAYRRGHDDCFHKTQPSQLDPTVVEPYTVAAGLIPVVLLAMAAFWLGKLSGYQAQKRNQIRYDGIYNVDISEAAVGAQPRRL